MSSGVDLDDLKAHLRIFGVREDSLINDYLETAEAHVLNHIRVDLNEDSDGNWPTPAKQSIRLLVAHWYHHREASGMSGTAAIPIGVKDLLAPLRNLCN